MSGGPLIVDGCQGETKLLGDDGFDTDQVDITSGAAQVLIAPSVSVRSSIGIRNNNDFGGAILYIGPTAVKAVPGSGWPLLPQGGITLTVNEGVTVYASSDGVDIDVRLITTGD